MRWSSVQEVRVSPPSYVRSVQFHISDSEYLGLVCSPTSVICDLWCCWCLEFNKIFSRLYLSHAVFCKDSAATSCMIMLIFQILIGCSDGVKELHFLGHFLNTRAIIFSDIAPSSEWAIHVYLYLCLCKQLGMIFRWPIRAMWDVESGVRQSGGLSDWELVTLCGEAGRSAGRSVIVEAKKKRPAVFLCSLSSPLYLSCSRARSKTAGGEDDEMFWRHL